MELPYGRPCRDLVRVGDVVTQHCRVGLLADIPTGLGTERAGPREMELPYGRPCQDFVRVGDVAIQHCPSGYWRISLRDFERERGARSRFR